MKTRIITAVVGLIVLAGVLFTFDTLVFNLVIAAITLIALHEIYSALGFEKQDWPLLAVLVPYTLLIMLSSYSVCRAMVMPASFLVVLFYAIYLVVRNGVISYQKASGLAMFSGIVIFCFYSFIRLKEMLPVEEYGYDAIFFILLILCFAWGGADADAQRTQLTNGSRNVVGNHHACLHDDDEHGNHGQNEVALFFDECGGQRRLIE